MTSSHNHLRAMKLTMMLPMAVFVCTLFSLVGCEKQQVECKDYRYEWFDSASKTWISKNCSDMCWHFHEDCEEICPEYWKRCIGNVTEASLTTTNDGRNWVFWFTGFVVAFVCLICSGSVLMGKRIIKHGCCSRNLISISVPERHTRESEPDYGVIDLHHANTEEVSADDYNRSEASSVFLFRSSEMLPQTLNICNESCQPLLCQEKAHTFSFRVDGSGDNLSETMATTNDDLPISDDEESHRLSPLRPTLFDHRIPRQNSSNLSLSNTNTSSSDVLASRCQEHALAECSVMHENSVYEHSLSDIAPSKLSQDEFVGHKGTCGDAVQDVSVSSSNTHTMFSDSIHSAKKQPTGIEIEAMVDISRCSPSRSLGSAKKRVTFRELEDGPLDQTFTISESNSKSDEILDEEPPSYVGKTDTNKRNIVNEVDCWDTTSRTAVLDSPQAILPQSTEMTKLNAKPCTETKLSEGHPRPPVSLLDTQFGALGDGNSNDKSEQVYSSGGTDCPSPSADDYDGYETMDNDVRQCEIVEKSSDEYVAIYSDVNYSKMNRRDEPGSITVAVSHYVQQEHAASGALNGRFWTSIDPTSSELTAKWNELIISRASCRENDPSLTIGISTRDDDLPPLESIDDPLSHVLYCRPHGGTFRDPVIIQTTLRRKAVGSLTVWYTATDIELTARWQKVGELNTVKRKLILNDGHDGIPNEAVLLPDMCGVVFYLHHFCSFVITERNSRRWCKAMMRVLIEFIADTYDAKSIINIRCILYIEGDDCRSVVEDSEALENRRYMVEGERKFLLYDDTTQMTVEIDEVKYTPNHSHEHLKPYKIQLDSLRNGIVDGPCFYVETRDRPYPSHFAAVIRVIQNGGPPATPPATLDISTDLNKLLCVRSRPPCCPGCFNQQTQHVHYPQYQHERCCNRPAILLENHDNANRREQANTPEFDLGLRPDSLGSSFSQTDSEEREKLAERRILAPKKIKFQSDGASSSASQGSVEDIRDASVQRADQQYEGNRNIPVDGTRNSSSIPEDDATDVGACCLPAAVTTSRSKSDEALSGVLVDDHSSDIPTRKSNEVRCDTLPSRTDLLRFREA